MRVRVLTFNVWNTEGDSRRVETINRELRRLDPDLIAFQEVVQTRETRMLFDQPINGVWASDHFGVIVDLEVGTDG